MRRGNFILLGLLLILFVFQSNCEEIIVTATNGTTTNQTTTNNTNTTTNTSEYCNFSNQTGCVLTQEQIIELLSKEGTQITPVILDQSGAAIPCPASCLSCTSGQQCSVCFIGYALDTNKNCVPCRGCKTCLNTDSASCTSCYLPQLLNTTSNKCEAPVGCTNPGCQTCSNATYCLSCFAGYSLFNNDCIVCITGCLKCTQSQTNCDSDGCGAGVTYFQNTRTGVNQCVTCTTGCLGCSSQNLNNCIGCAQGYYPLLDNTQTPPSNKCKPCFMNCQSCTTATTCSSCISGYKVTEDKLRCVLVCSDNCYTCAQNKPSECLTCYSGNIFNTTTKACDANMTCNTTGTCTACSLGNVLVNGFCQTCQVPDTHCSKCLAIDVTACSLCVTGYYLSNGVCTICPAQCTVCLSQYACSSCKDGYVLKAQTGQATGNCIPCQNPCATCYQGVSVCVTCKSGFTLNGTQCLGQNNVGFSLAIDIPLSMYGSISTDFTAFIINIMLSLNPDFEAWRLILFNLGAGSTEIEGAVSVDSPAEAQTASSTLSSSLAEGVLIGGSPILTSTTTVNTVSETPTSGSSNLGLILGVSIPLLVIVLAILIIISVKLSKNADYQDIRRGLDSQTQKGVKSQSV